MKVTKGTATHRPVRTLPKIYDHEVVCCCFPLRTAVALIGANIFIVAVALFFDRAGTEEYLRHWVGGYARKTRVVIGLLDSLGIVFGPLAIVGAVQLTGNYLRLVLGFQVVRLVAQFFALYIDVPLLWKCEMWGSDVKSAADMYGWNEVMFEIAVESRCPQERVSFLFYCIPSLLFSVYCVTVTQKLWAEIEDEPAYLFNTPLSATTGAFLTRSLASESLQQYLKEDAERPRQPVERLSQKSPALMPNYASVPVGPIISQQPWVNQHLRPASCMPTNFVSVP